MITLDPETSRRVFEISRSVWFWYNSIKDMSGFSIRDEGGGWFAPDALPENLLAILHECGRSTPCWRVAALRRCLQRPRLRLGSD